MGNINPTKWEKIFLIIVFSIIIFLPFIGWCLIEDRVASSIEKRNLSSKPPVPQSLTDFSAYPEKFEEYFSDHFGFREFLIKEYFKFVNRADDKTYVDDVTHGKDGWLFLGSIKTGYSKYSDPIGDAMNINLYTEKELQDFAERLTVLRDWLASKGIQYVYMVAPNKHTIYFDKLPQYVKKKNKYSAMDQLLGYLSEHTDVEVVDLRPALLEARKEGDVYFRTDTHWNNYGTNVAQYEIMKKVASLFPGKIKPLKLPKEQFRINSRGGGDLAIYAQLKNISEESPMPVFTQECEGPDYAESIHEELSRHTVICEKNGLNAVVFRDSFFKDLKPYIARYFGRSTYIWEKMDYELLTEYVEKEKPDIVINEVVERKLPYLPSDSLLMLRK